MMRTQLEVHQITADVRGNDPDAPVLVGQDGMRVVMILNPDEAETLAKVLARFDATHPAEVLDFEFDRTVWLHAMVDLLASKSATTGRPVPVYAQIGGVAR